MYLNGVEVFADVLLVFLVLFWRVALKGLGVEVLEEEQDRSGI